jgi:hypothetical protein
MRRVWLLLAALACRSAIVVGEGTPPATLDIHYIDTEGGQATRTDSSFTVTNERTGYTKEDPATRRTTAATR